MLEIEAVTKVTPAELGQLCERAERFPGLREPPRDDFESYRLSKLPETLRSYPCVPSMQVGVEFSGFDEAKSREIIATIAASDIFIVLRREWKVASAEWEAMVGTHLGNNCGLKIGKHAQLANRDVWQPIFQEFLDLLGLTSITEVLWSEIFGYVIESRSPGIIMYNHETADDTLSQGKLMYGVPGDFSVWGVSLDKQFAACDHFTQKLAGIGRLSAHEPRMLASFLPERFDEFRGKFTASEIADLKWSVHVMTMPSGVTFKNILEVVDRDEGFLGKIFTINKQKNRPRMDGYVEIGKDRIEVTLQSELDVDADGAEIDRQLCETLNLLSGKEDAEILI